MSRVAFLFVYLAAVSAGAQGRAVLRASSTPAWAVSTDDEPFEHAETLDRAGLIQAVLRRNPSLEAARQAWQAALDRVDQAAALEDPRLSYSVAPLSIGSDSAGFGQIVGLSQALPWPGTLRLRGEVAEAEAEAARRDYEAVRQRLALIAALLFDDLYAVERGIEVNEEHIRLLGDFKRVATARYAAGLASQQDPLQAEVEVAKLLHRRISLDTSRDVLRSRLNALLHRPPEAVLPRLPATLADSADAPPTDSRVLEDEAVAHRPELLAAEASVLARRRAVALKKRDLYPDFQLQTAYNSLWGEHDIRWTAGVGVRLPLRRGRIHAAIAEAEARLAASEGARAAREDEVRSEVRQAALRAVEAGHVVELYRDRLLPAAGDEVRAARAGFEAGKNDFLALIEADRNQRSVELDYQRALADRDAMGARLDHALGRLPKGVTGASGPSQGQEGGVQ